MIGQTGYKTLEVAKAVGIARNKTTEKLLSFEDRLKLIAKGLRQVQPNIRVDRLTEMITAVIDTGGEPAVVGPARWPGRVPSVRREGVFGTGCGVFAD